MTTGHVVVMGRKTFESLKGRLPNRTNLILTRRPRQFIRTHPHVFGQYKEWRGGKHLRRPYQLRFTKIGGAPMEQIFVFSSLRNLQPATFASDIFICGGAQIYAQTLPLCSDL